MCTDQLRGNCAGQIPSHPGGQAFVMIHVVVSLD